MRVALKSAIFASGHSQRRVAALSGIPENKLSEIVRGWAMPSERERSALRSVLGVADAVFDVGSEAEAGGAPRSHRPHGESLKRLERAARTRANALDAAECKGTQQRYEHNDSTDRNNQVEEGRAGGRPRAASRENTLPSCAPR